MTMIKNKIADKINSANKGNAIGVITSITTTGSMSNMGLSIITGSFNRLNRADSLNVNVDDFIINYNANCIHNTNCLHNKLTPQLNRANNN